MPLPITESRIPRLIAIDVVRGMGAVTRTARPINTGAVANNLPPFTERTATIGGMTPIGQEVC